MSDLLTGQIKDVFTLIDEEQGTIDVASVRQRRATTGTVLLA